MGPLVDRYSAGRFFPFYQLPLIAGFIVLALVPAWWAVLVFLFTSGISLGSSSPIKSAIIAETFGTERLGGVRSVFTALMVFGSAIGPMVVGLFLDAGSGFPPILLVSAFILVLVSMLSYHLLRDETPVENAA